MRSVCPTDNTVSAFAEGTLLADASASFQMHLAECADCRMLVAGVVRQTTSRRTPLVAGRALHRYIIERPLGRGAMGEVYAAFDPELQRKIAVKLLDQSWVADATARARLLREAQAIAKVSHPNVVVVHDVGTVDDEVFIAMALVSGGTLRDWLQQPRSREAILDTFVAAGRGLAAAHAVGLVHRDFKPDNVLMERDVPRVSDFGLALPPGELPRATRDDATARLPEVDLTVTGALVGTPAYMSPEQWRLEELDARSDQFSFCVALYEALLGQRPFVGRTLSELASAVREGPRPRGSGLPTWLRRIVLRGLSVERRARFPSMDELCDALKAGLRRKRRSPIWIGAGAALGIAIGTGVWVRQQTLCRGFESELVGQYDATMRSRIKTALASNEAALPAATVETIVNLIDEYASEWITTRYAACRATRITGDQSEALLDQRVACLADRRAELGRVAALLSEGDVIAKRGALRAVTGLAPIADCADLSRLRGELPEPADPGERHQLRVLRDQLSALRASFNLARYREAQAALDELFAPIVAIKFPQLLADAHFLEGQLATALGDYPRAENALREAALAAEAARDDVRRGEAWAELVATQLTAKRTADAIATYRLAEAAISRAPRPSIEANLLRSKGVIASRQDDFENALVLAEAALTKVRSEPLATRDRRIEARLVQDVGLDMLVLGKPNEALARVEEAHAILRGLYGEDHPSMADIQDALMVVNRVLGRHQTALASAKRGLALRRAVLGDKHERTFNAMKHVVEYELSFGNLAAAKPLLIEMAACDAAKTPSGHTGLLEMEAKIALTESRWPDVERLYRELLAIPVPAGETEDVTRATWQQRLAGALAEQGKGAEADALFKTAFERTVALLGPDDQDTSHSRYSYARFLRQRGRLAEAKAQAERLLAAYDRKGDKSPKRRLEALGLLALIEKDLGEKAAARRHFELAIAEWRGNPELDDDVTGRVLANYAALRLSMGERGDEIVKLLDDAKRLIAPDDRAAAQELADAYARAKR